MWSVNLQIYTVFFNLLYANALLYSAAFTLE